MTTNTIGSLTRRVEALEDHDVQSDIGALITAARQTPDRSPEFTAAELAELAGQGGLQGRIAQARLRVRRFKGT